MNFQLPILFFRFLTISGVWHSTDSKQIAFISFGKAVQFSIEDPDCLSISVSLCYSTPLATAESDSPFLPVDLKDHSTLY